MKFLALALGVLALGAPATRVLGFDYDGRRLAYFDPATLARLGTTTTPYNASLCSWSYSPDREHLAVSDCQGTLRFFSSPSLKPEGRIGWTDQLGRASGLAWLAPRRLVAVSAIGTDNPRVATIDPIRRRVVQRLTLDGIPVGRALVGDTSVVLVTPSGHFGPPKARDHRPRRRAANGRRRSLLVRNGVIAQRRRLARRRASGHRRSRSIRQGVMPT